MPRRATGDGSPAKPQRSAAEYVPVGATLGNLRTAAAQCRGCDLYAAATQTVFGEGDVHARIMFVGEQPGDREDRTGRPFVGPAGKLLERALAQAGIERERVYVTNAVKHFKYVERGKQRIHATPKVTEIRACRPWLEAEIRQVKPGVIVALGATAAQTLLGSGFLLTQHRGEFITTDLAARVLATVHPSSILRAVDDETRTRELAAFIDDLKIVAQSV